MAKPELVGHDAFYMKELNDMIDIRRDYDLWQARRVLHMVCVSLFRSPCALLSFVQDNKMVSFCDYPFLFDLKAKICKFVCLSVRSTVLLSTSSIPRSIGDARSYSECVHSQLPDHDGRPCRNGQSPADVTR